jgi:hypothetical protein
MSCEPNLQGFFFNLFLPADFNNWNSRVDYYFVTYSLMGIRSFSGMFGFEFCVLCPLAQLPTLMYYFMPSGTVANIDVLFYYFSDTK